MNFQEIFSEYLEYDFNVLPIKYGMKYPHYCWKHTHDRVMTAVEFSNAFAETGRKKFNIGLVLGKTSGICVLDVDTDDWRHKEVLKLIPNSPVKKKGKKGVTYFYRYNGLENAKFHPFEILSYGNQTILPPSRHPDGMDYVWLGPSLLEFDIDDLPELPKNINEILEPFADKREEKGVRTTGRDNKITEMFCAAIHSGEEMHETIGKVLEYDKKYHSPPFFSDMTESKNKFKDPYKNALAFYGASVSSLAKKGRIERPVEIILPQKKNEEEKEDRIRFPRLRGIMQEYFEEMYRTAPVERSRFIYPSALMFLSSAIANKIQFQGFYPNLYMAIIGESGSGKNLPLSKPMDIIGESNSKNMLGTSDIVSDNSILMGFKNQSSQLITIDEASKLFRINGKSYNSSVIDLLAELYTKPGKYYPGKMAMKYGQGNRLGECHSPYVNLFCALTIEDLRENFNKDFIQKGVGARFMYFLEDEEKKRKRKLKQFDNKRFVSFVNCCRNSHVNPLDNSSVNMGISDSMNGRLDEIYDELNGLSSNNSMIRASINRAYEFFCKMLILDTVSTKVEDCNFDYGNIVATHDNIDWAYSTTKNIVKMQKKIIEDYASLSKKEVEMKKMLSIIKKEFKISKSDLTRRTQYLETRVRNEIVIDLISSNQIIEIKQKDNSLKRSTFYMIK